MAAALRAISHVQDPGAFPRSSFCVFVDAFFTLISLARPGSGRRRGCRVGLPLQDAAEHAGRLTGVKRRGWPAEPPPAAGAGAPGPPLGTCAAPGAAHLRPAHGAELPPASGLSSERPAEKKKRAGC